ncbi:MAG: transglutaminase family protein [Campylobacterales bacterium]|nr:transglutaminase family protein [Campylobacterales bacterium]
MIYTIYHKTSFKYQSMVSFSHNIARLQPQESRFQKLRQFSMEITPQPFESNDFKDVYGNDNKHILIREPHKELTVIGKSRVEIFPELIEENIVALQKNSISYKDALQRLTNFHVDDVEAKEFLFESELITKASKEIREYALESFQPTRDLYEAALEFMERIFKDFAFVSGFSDITTPIEEIFKAKKGVCQDFAQFAIAALRSIGLPAKYMSGYIETLPPEGEEKLFGVDASHAWFALYIPNAGWAEFDPTNNMVPREQHIKLGSGKDYYDISPLKGVVLSSGSSHLNVMVDVRREKEPKEFSMQSQSKESKEQVQNQF